MRFQIKAIQHFRQSLSNRSGVALMVAVSCLVFIMYLAMEISYDSNVEYLVNSQSLNRIKAYYAAKSGMQLSLLRIKIYQQAQRQLGAQLGNSPLLDKIWQFPFAWPLPIPDELNAIDKDKFKKIFKESAMDSSYLATIEDEGSKIDLNDLVSPSKYLQETTRRQLLNIFEQKKKSDEQFANDYSNTNFQELINNIGDWMSSKSQSLNGGDKRGRYSIINQESQSDYYPPNRSFRTLAELNLVPGMNDDFFELLRSRVTIYGMKGINPNLATKEVLKSLDPGMTDEAVAAIVARRSDPNTQFKCDAEGKSPDFWNFVVEKGVRLVGEVDLIPLTCDSVMNFKIRSTGEFAGVTREITAIVVDLNKTAAKIKTLTDKEKQLATPANPANPSAPPAKAPTMEPIQKGPPRIVFWSER